MPALDAHLPSPIEAIASTHAARGAPRIAAFFALLTLLAVLLDAFIGQGLRRLNSGDFGEWNRIVRGEVNADLIINGSSRAQTHYDPRLISAATGLSAHNIGLNGSQTDMQLARLKTYLKHNRKPKWVIQNLDVFSLQVSHREVYDPGQYIPYLDEPVLYAALSAVNADTWKARWLPLYGYAAFDLRFGWLQALRYWLGIADGSAPQAFDGFRPHRVEWTGEFEAFRARHPDGTAVAIEPEGIAQLSELLRLCGSMGIGVVLVYSPEYNEVQPLTINRAEVFARFAALADRHRVRLIDFSMSPIGARKELFYNSQHLNADGAAAFTRELTARLDLTKSAASVGGVR